MARKRQRNKINDKLFRQKRGSGIPGIQEIYTLAPYRASVPSSGPMEQLADQAGFPTASHDVTW